MVGLVEWDGVLSGERFCLHCRKNIAIRLSYDVGVMLYWVGGLLVFDVVLVFGKCRIVEGNVLYREVYSVKG